MSELGYFFCGFRRRVGFGIIFPWIRREIVGFGNASAVYSVEVLLTWLDSECLVNFAPRLQRCTWERSSVESD